jgi:hypothetical protein
MRFNQVALRSAQPRTVQLINAMKEAGFSKIL